MSTTTLQPMPVSKQLEVHQPRLNHPVFATGFRIAATLQEVTRAWRAVYEVYVSKGLIVPNPFGIHTSHYAVGRQSLVLTDCPGLMTMTAIRDTTMGLPLDSLYGPELDQLRGMGRRLTEVGLFVDRCPAEDRTIEHLFALMNPAIAYSFAAGGTDIIIGVHPRHGRFYQRALGFEVLGEERSYAAVNHHPCLLLRLPHERLHAGFLPRGLEFCAQHPVNPAIFDHRADFVCDVELRMHLDAYLAHKDRQSAAMERAA